MGDLSQRLRDKGWDEKEIQKAMKIMSHAEKKKKPSSIKFLDSAVYWFILLLMLLGNFAISVVLIPFLIVLNSIQLYLIIAVIAISFGLLFTLLIKELDNIARTHVIVAGVFIPAIAVINVFIITNLANLFIPFMQINNHLQSPLLIGLVYGISFTIPYLFQKSVHQLSQKFHS